jgi:hypothetical protein
MALDARLTEGGTSTSPNASKTAAQLAAEAAYTTAANAVKNTKAPTQSQINALKNAASAKSAAIPALPDYSQIVPQAQESTKTAINEAKTAITDVNTAGAEVGAISQSMGGPGFDPVGGITPTDTKMADAYQRLYDEFNAIGLGALVSDAKDELMKATSISAIPNALRQTKTYQTRFSANDARIKAGLAALNPADYLAKEDAYQNIMRNYGLPSTYYTPGLYGKQEGFDKLLANDVSAVELEDRISTAQKRVLNANPEVLAAIKNFYGDSITNGDILGYVLNPQQGLTDIKKKVTAAEIQGAANTFGLNKITAESTPDQIKALEARASALAGYGIDKAQAQQGFAQVAEMAPIGSQLADIYKQTPYTQATAESEVFGTSGAAAAKEQRKKLTALEQASFSGSSGVGALGRDKSAYGLTQGQTGLY